MNQQITPLFGALQSFSHQHPLSFHVPGHKNGEVFADKGLENFAGLLPLDVTELTGLDDLHAPTGIIKEAQDLAADWFGADETFFLVGGSTAGNLAMMLTAAVLGRKVLVQRNCHKSILNGLELSGVEPVFAAPAYDDEVDRYTAPALETMKQAIDQHPEIGAIVLTYPDYFGTSFDLKAVVEMAHQHHIAVLVDEAHGVHFSLSEKFPVSALDAGADIVVQSAHKMAPAMTMASFLHIKSSIIDRADVAHYLQMIQSSSPSYPLMASLDLARYYLAGVTENKLQSILDSTNRLRMELSSVEGWKVAEIREGVDDPLKITLQVDKCWTGTQVAKLFEEQGIHPELSTDSHILFIHGLAPFQEWVRLKTALEKISGQLKFLPNRDTIGSVKFEQQQVQSLEFSYQTMNRMRKEFLNWTRAEGEIAAQAVIPYPPGIPLLLKGEKITASHIKMINYLIKQGINFQNHHIEQGIHCLR
ncbi:aminotransferase class I/II-fold pyridoxal phosphate-dependent enzyme [Virgibacillus senegalensis]|uniref:aminotransferase class I/II-fold pyridoxal phosphate-dependent enzyme n=1 Tax=Virgibacillus senegalensis TaxID=1499679 RepID=UPI00069D6379|nr:aminotransferase class I/II-fold pyridoxal phosphate-dependent enzyme [Virgibacillus senegalensis]